MKNVILTDGFELEVDETLLDNAELIEALADLADDESPVNMARVVRLTLSKESKDALYEHLRDERGIVPMSRLNSEFTHIFPQIGAKN